MAVYEVKANDTEPLVAHLLDRDGPVSLTGASVRFIMRRVDAKVAKVNAAATIDADQTTNPGLVAYAWAPGDLDTPDIYRAEFEVTFQSGLIKTFPNDSYIDVIVHDDLD